MEPKMAHMDQKIADQKQVKATQDRVLIVDFGSQVTQLIARRVREAGVYSEIVPFDKAEAALDAARPSAIILSGGPASVHESGTPQAPRSPVFAPACLCLAFAMASRPWWRRWAGRSSQGRAANSVVPNFEIVDRTPLFEACSTTGERAQVWMSHGDRVTKLPPGFRAVGISTGAPFAAIADDTRKLYGVQFHPEVVHTPKGAALIANFVREIARLLGDWTMAQFRDGGSGAHRRQVGAGRVVCGLSGGVDSSVAALLIHEAIGDQLTCIFVDHGLLRQGRGRTRSSSCSAGTTTSR